jgi:NFU1 iron-sulfur cluster scaffold homolog, mitochondrial
MSETLERELVALHPERTDNPRTIRWHVAGSRVDHVAASSVRELAGPILDAVQVGTDHVLTTLADGGSWARDASEVRDAVREAVARARQASAAEAAADPDGSLKQIATRVLVEDVAPYAAGHGGFITVSSVHDGIVEVEMGGACHGCPAATFTVQGRLAPRLAAESPAFTEVRVNSH